MLYVTRVLGHNRNMDLYTMKALAKELGITYAHLRRVIAEGKRVFNGFVVVKVGRDWVAVKGKKAPRVIDG